jgi:hypothetical protein
LPFAIQTQTSGPAKPPPPLRISSPRSPRDTPASPDPQPNTPSRPEPAPNKTPRKRAGQAEIEALARRCLAVLSSGPRRYHDLAGLVHATPADLTPALAHESWFDKRDEDGLWEVTDAGLKEINQPSSDN